MDNRFKLLLVTACLVTLAFTALPARAGIYTYTSLGDIKPTGISNDGRIAGEDRSASLQDVYLSSPTAAPQTFASLGGPADVLSPKMTTSGAVVGGSWNNASYYWEVGSSPQMYAPPVGGQNMIHDANSNGQMTGYQTYSGVKSAVRWTGGVAQRLTYGGLADARGEGYAINDSGWVAGSAYGSFPTSAVVWQAGSTDATVILQGDDARATDVNNLGQVVGDFYQSGSSTPSAFLWDNGSLQMLAGITDAFFLNDAGQIVGLDVSGNTVVYDLNTGSVTSLAAFLPGTTDTRLLYVTGLNESGQLVGLARVNGVVEGFVMTPNATPIPGAVWLLGSGLAGLFGWRRKRNS